jgi:hypothetical protein
MSRSFVVGVSLAIGLVQPPAPNELTPEERREGYELLFDGTSLTNWHARSLGEKPATWRARDGILSYEPGDSWLASDRTFTDFILRLEYRTGPESDSGIFLRSTPSGYPSFTGFEIEIKNDAAAAPAPRSNTSIYGAATPAERTTKDVKLGEIIDYRDSAILALSSVRPDRRNVRPSLS